MLNVSNICMQYTMLTNVALSTNLYAFMNIKTNTVTLFETVLTYVALAY